MASDVKGARTIRTMARLVDGRRVRTPAAALLELSAIANEKQLLKRELDRYTRRNAEIAARLGELAEKEQRLMAMATNPDAQPDLPVRVRPAGAPEAAAEPRDPAAGFDRKFKVQEFSY